MAGKEAVIFIIDSNYTMNAPYPPQDYTCVKSESSSDAATTAMLSDSKPAADDDNDDSPPDRPNTRLNCAKKAVLDSIINLAWRSKTHEVGVVVLKTRVTHHHLSQCDDVDDYGGIRNNYGEEEEGLGHLFDTGENGIRNDYVQDSDDADDEMKMAVPFPNLIELVPFGGIDRPTTQLLRDIQKIQSTTFKCNNNNNNHKNKRNNNNNNNNNNPIIQGDFCDGIILAADALYRRTAGKKFLRKIILITDAEHEVQVDGEQLGCVLSGLKKMDCALGVVGIGFENGGEFGVSFLDKKPSGDGDDGSEEEENEVVSIADSNDDDDEEDDENDNNDQDDESDVAIKEENGDPNPSNSCNDDFQLLIKRENEKLLLSLAQQTGGWVTPANNGQNLTTLVMNHPSSSKASSSTGLTKSVRTKIELRIAPNLTIQVRSMLLTTPKKIPHLKKEVHQLDPQSGKPLRDALGEFMTHETRTLTTNYDADDPEIEVPQYNTTYAYPYGCDLIPVGKMDMLGIKAAFASPSCIEMIGYVAISDVPTHLLMGPAYAIVGGKESRRGRVAVAALARGMEEKGVYGFCRFVKKVDVDPVIGVLIPKLEGSNLVEGGEDFAVDEKEEDLTRQRDGGRYLVFLQLPYAEDVQDIPPPKVDADIYGDNYEANACDELIDSLILPEREFESTNISNPSIKSYQRMVAHYAMHPPALDEEDLHKSQTPESILEASGATPLCEFDAIKSLHAKASTKIDTFLDAFPLTKIVPLNSKDVKQTKKYWGDGI